MVKRLIYVLVLALWLNPAQAAVPLVLDATSVSLGQAINVSFEAPLAPGVEIGNLDVLKRDFDVTSVLANTATVKGRSVTRYALTLYPLHTGTIRIPSLTAGPVSTRALTVKIMPSNSIELSSGLAPTNPWNRQPVELYIEIADDGAGLWTPPQPPAIDNAFVRELATVERFEGPLRRRLLRFAWAVMPLAAAQYTIRFPTLEATRFGQRLRFSVPLVSFSARPLPGYLPRDIPVGRISIESAHTPSSLQLRRPAAVRLTLRASGMGEGELQRTLSALLPTTADMRFYPLSVQLTGSGNALEQDFEVTLPFSPQRAGPVRLPDIVLPYWDPNRARVESTVLRMPSLTVTNPLWRDLGVAALLVGLLILFGVAGPRGLVWLRRGKALRESRRRLRHAATERALLDALQVLTPGLSPARSRVWLETLACDFRTSSALSHAAAATLRLRYGRGEPFESTRRALQHALRELSPRWN